MTSIAISPGAAAPSPLAATAATRPSRALGVLLVAEAMLSLAPVAILGAAIGWPASLGKPPAEQMAAIAAAPGAVQAGYGLYLLYSLLVAPLMVALAARLGGGLGSPLGMAVAAFGALSALARSIGILRWLTVMPALATAHAAADAPARAAIESLFAAVNAYGGGIGEMLGVSLLMSAAMATLGIGALRRGGLPTWLAWWAIVVSIALAALALPMFGGPSLMPVAAAVTLLTAWMLAAGLRCLFGGVLR